VFGKIGMFFLLLQAFSLKNGKMAAESGIQKIKNQKSKIRNQIFF